MTELGVRKDIWFDFFAEKLLNTIEIEQLVQVLPLQIVLEVLDTNIRPRCKSTLVFVEGHGC